ncbi:hypothetical protein pdul_cds_842 [Pandoravirus dulcis]|uniref:Uncharacterized protein n=1 Tax=Pandoravirus dulcis TaxID=1349409 RepID=S4VUH6_9VIRU|nr:hypothetical protein pdul_cds_842 [Pandoravirus dulcis]AGO83055.1 hypothetical protein pdul_cds_842 [Pandoravirus dulcis]
MSLSYRFARWHLGQDPYAYMADAEAQIEIYRAVEARQHGLSAQQQRELEQLKLALSRVRRTIYDAKVKCE